MLKLSSDSQWGLSVLLVQVASKRMDSMPASSALTLDTSATYEIRIQGYLDENWADCFSSVSIRIEHEPDTAPVTVIAGKFQD